MIHSISRTLVFYAVLLAVGCGQKQPDPAEKPPAAPVERAVVKEAWESVRNEADNVDSPAFWRSPDGMHILIATAKATDRLLIYDAASGSLLRTVGSSGSGKGQLKRPNGIATVDDLAIVVERDNHRVQVFRLPDWTSLGFFGGNALVKPYGVAITRDGADYLLYITDNYETADEMVPPPAELGARVKQFRLTVKADKAEGRLVRSFGATSGDGVLHVVESICADTVHNILLIADEDARENDIKIYDFDGGYTGRTVGKGLFKSQPEGIVLYECPDGGGYWIMTDQGKSSNTFLVFDRESFDFLGSFTGAVTLNTDGIALTQMGFGTFPSGSFFAVHDDGNVAAFNWADVATALKLEPCVK